MIIVFIKRVERDTHTEKMPCKYRGTNGSDTLATTSEAGCSQEEGPKKGFVMGSRAQGVQEILEKCM